MVSPSVTSIIFPCQAAAVPGKRTAKAAASSRVFMLTEIAIIAGFSFTFTPP